jgi:hypothetical protein
MKIRRGVWERQRQWRRRMELLGGFLNVHIDTNFDHRNTVLLCGSPRSGTTWATDILNYDNSYRLMLEPFNSDHVRLCRAFHRWQYLAPENDDLRFLEPARSIMSGNVRDAWIDRRNRRIIADRRLIKQHGLLMLGWLRRHFPGVQTVYLMRHPLAVVNSRLQLGWKQDVREYALTQPALVRDHLLPFQQAIESAQGDWESLLLCWCIENYVALKQLPAADIHLLSYERLCTDPRAEIQRLFDGLGRKVDDRVFARMRKPSVQARVSADGAHSAVLARTNLIDAWRDSVSDQQMDRALDILRLFGLDRVYCEKSMPRL